MLLDPEMKGVLLLPNRMITVRMKDLELMNDFEDERRLSPIMVLLAPGQH